jgi:hypothetical protein
VANKLEATFVAAFDAAIRKVGFQAFKATSLFGSNEAAHIELKKAA